MRRQQCTDCRVFGEESPAAYTCTEAKCGLKALCGAHVTAHRQWGHTVSALVPEDDAAPAPDALLGVTHCVKPEHSGPEGALTHVCRQCGAGLVCRSCSDDHLGTGHDLCTVEAAAAKATADISAALPVLREGLARRLGVLAQRRAQLDTLASRRAVAIEALGVATARLHAAVDARQAALLAEIEVAYGRQVAAVEGGVAADRGCVAELATVVATAEGAAYVRTRT